jgi:hypothetical protein
LIALLFILLTTLLPKNPTVGEVLAMMNTSTIKNNTLEYDFKMQERWMGKTNKAENHTKLSISPYSVYMKFSVSSSPAKEVLYNPALYGSKAQVNIGKYIPTIGLEPLGNKMRSGQHHTLLDGGVSTINRLMQKTYITHAKEMEANAVIEPLVVFMGKNCLKMTLNSTTFAYSKYVGKKGDNAAKLAKDKLLSEYLILEKNNLSNYEESLEGRTILLPNLYNKKSILYLDLETHIPIHQEFYDDMGIFEQYTYFNIKQNPVFNALDFNKDNKTYGF